MARELLVLIGTSLLLAAPAAAQSPRLAERFQHEQWPAFWIAAQDGPSRDAGVFHFRRTLRLAAVPARLVVHVSADNRYLAFSSWAGNLVDDDTNGGPDAFVRKLR